MEKKKVKKRKHKTYTKSEKILFIVFSILLIAVAILGIITMKMSQDSKNIQADIVIPITSKNTNERINIDLSGMGKGELKEYVFRITNYKDKKQLEKSLNYQLAFSLNNQSVTLKLYKNKGTTDLLEKGTKLKLTGNTLKGNNQQDDLYHLIIKTLEAPEKNAQIYVKVTS